MILISETRIERIMGLRRLILSEDWHQVPRLGFGIG